MDNCKNGRIDTKMRYISVDLVICVELKFEKKEKVSTEKSRTEMVQSIKKIIYYTLFETWNFVCKILNDIY